MIRVSLILLSALFALQASATCSAPSNANIGTGKTGELKMATPSGTSTFNKLMYCDGTTWQDLGGSPTATACTKNGEIKISGGEMTYCNSSLLWRFDSGSATNGTCSKSGETRWNSTQLEFCNGTNWRVVAADSAIDATQSDINDTNQVIEAARAAYSSQITGFTGGTGTFTFTNDAGSTCTGYSVKVCSDNTGCSSAIASRTTSGTLNVPNGSYIRFGIILSTQANTTCSWTAAIGGQTFSYNATTTTSDTTPTIQAFTDLNSQAQSTVVTSNIVKVSGHTGVTASVSDNSLGGTPEFRVCSDSACTTVDTTWGTASQFLTNPKYIQLRVTTGSTAFDLKKVSLTAGTVTVYWHVTTSTCPVTTTLSAGASLACTCPAGAINYNANVTGTLNYKQSASVVCKAAVHAGAVTNASGGSVTVIGNTAGSPSGTCSSFTGSTANGVSSLTAGSSTSYYFSGTTTDVCH